MLSPRSLRKRQKREGQSNLRSPWPFTLKGVIKPSCESYPLFIQRKKKQKNKKQSLISRQKDARRIWRNKRALWLFPSLLHLSHILWTHAIFWLYALHITSYFSMAVYLSSKLAIKYSNLTILSEIYIYILIYITDIINIYIHIHICITESLFCKSETNTIL